MANTHCTAGNETHVSYKEQRSVIVMLLSMAIQISTYTVLHAQEPIDGFRGLPWFSSLDAVQKRIGDTKCGADTTNHNNIYTAISYYSCNQEMFGLTGRLAYHTIDGELTGGWFQHSYSDTSWVPSWYDNVIRKLALKYGEPKVVLINGNTMEWMPTHRLLSGYGRYAHAMIEWHDSEMNTIRLEILNGVMTLSYFSVRLNKLNLQFEDH